MLRRLTVLVIAVIITGVALIGVSYIYNTYGSGTLQIKITDPPSWGQATQVYLNYGVIEVHRTDGANTSGWFTIVDKSEWISLIKVLNINQTLGSKPLQAGLYNLIRFTILDAIVTVSGKNYTATVPSGKLQVAITKGGIRIVTGQTATLLIDLNTKVVGFYKIVPDIRATPV